MIKPLPAIAAAALAATALLVPSLASGTPTTTTTTRSTTSTPAEVRHGKLAKVAALARKIEAAKAAKVKATEIVQDVAYQGQTFRLRLHPVEVRAPGFQVLVQQADGALLPVAVAASRAYLGSVDGRPDALASGIVTSTGDFDGQVVLDRGATWFFRSAAAGTGWATGSVTGTRGTTPPASYKWPSATDASLNVSVAPGQVGATTYRWDLGFDLSYAWFTDAATIGGKVAAAVDAVDLATVSLLDVYVPDAQLRPAARRVVIRAAQSHDPYDGSSSPLGTAKTEWENNQAGSGVDDVALFRGVDGGSGVAYVGSAGSVWGVASNGGFGVPRAVLRHELGHTWGAHDNHTNGPEGATINSGNAYERFDGTELSAILRYRDSKQASSGAFTVVPRPAEPVPPYAALDLVDNVVTGRATAVQPVANDHDANGDALALSSVAGTSALGGTVTRSGGTLSYTPPASAAAGAVDSVTYVVRDATGRTATGVVLFRIDG